MVKLLASLGFCAAMVVSAPALAETKEKAVSSHNHSHDHAPKQDKNVYNGYFEDNQVKDRKLSDWEGDWQSVYPHLKDGTLDAVFAHKAKHGDKSAKEYSDYYEIGYRTDVDRIVIKGDEVSFYT